MVRVAPSERNKREGRRKKMGLRINPEATEADLRAELVELEKVLNENKDDKQYWVWYMMREIIWKELENRKN
jgi:hypothetical protein